jgi:hypothetical protein
MFVLRCAISLTMVRAPVGASPSGKAADFDSAIRRFESSRPSQLSPSPYKLSAILRREGRHLGLPTRLLH